MSTLDLLSSITLTFTRHKSQVYTLYTHYTLYTYTLYSISIQYYNHHLWSQDLTPRTSLFIASTSTMLSQHPYSSWPSQPKASKLLLVASSPNLGDVHRAHPTNKQNRRCMMMRIQCCCISTIRRIIVIFSQVPQPNPPIFYN